MDTKNVREKINFLIMIHVIMVFLLILPAASDLSFEHVKCTCKINQKRDEEKCTKVAKSRKRNFDSHRGCGIFSKATCPNS